MLLVINSNNTNTVFGVFAGEAKRATWRISTDPRRTADEYAVWLTHLMALEALSFADIDGVILSNVVPQAAFNLRSLCQRYFKTDPLVVGDPAVKLGFEIRMERPEEAGAYRLANAAGARSRYTMPGVVIDLGTATTFDVIDLLLLSEARKRYRVKVLGFCLLPNHFHLVLEPAGQTALCQFMQWLLTSHVRRYHKHYGSSGHVWQGRFKSFPIQRDEHLITVLRYVVQNPVRAGLSSTAREWPWSSLHRPRLADPSPVDGRR